MTCFVGFSRQVPAGEAAGKQTAGSKEIEPLDPDDYFVVTTY